MRAHDRIRIQVRQEGLEAWVALTAGEVGDRKTLENVLDEAGIRFGIDAAAIEALTDALANEAALPAERCVARGVPCEAGIPEVLELDDPQSLLPGHAREDGSLDYRERRLIVPVADGDRLGRIRPAIPGKPGRDVYGEEIGPPACEPLVLAHGDGVAIEPDGTLRATRDGARTLGPDGSIDVVELHVHAGAVDLQSGNLRTEGSLEIARDVTSGMSVDVRRDLVIKGTLDGGRARADGSIQIAGGAIGRESGSVHACGDLEVRHALGIELSARGLVRVVRGVSTSRLIGREIEVGGRLLGDSAQAESRIRVAEAGSPAGGPCWLRAAYPLSIGDPLDCDADAPPARWSRPTEALSARKGRGRGRSRHARADHAARQDLEARIDWRNRQRALQRIAVIEVSGTAHPGCRIDFGGPPLVLEEAVHHRAFRFDPVSDAIVQSEL